MCGIAGLLQFDNQSADCDRTALLTKALTHRGPDDEGIIARGPAALGHRRLSIIDLEGGRQPLANEDETIWITFNGEIYNYRELREYLRTKGYVFRTKSDTEVIVHAYEEWGDSCVERLRGMFAFAVLDERARRLFLARDHFGIKPLYYLRTDTFLAFASELQALRILPGVDWTLDLKAIDEYLWLGYIPAPNTIYRNVKKLPPAHRLSVTFDGQCSPPEEYWRLEFKPNLKRSEDDTLGELDEVLRESVRAHLVADVPFGAFLSGGVDSSTIVAYMAEMLGHPIETFSIGFEEADFNELAYARQVAKIFQTEHHEEIVRPEALSILPKLVQHYGEPFGDSSAIPTYHLSRLARSRVPMVLSGDGGDECFAGYDSYRAWMHYIAGPDPRPLWRQMLRPIAEILMPWRYQPLVTPKLSLSAWLRFVQYIPYALRQALWLPELHSACTEEQPLFEREYRKAASLSTCSQVQYLDIKTYLPYDILTKVDIASMMHGLEVRTPIVDIKVVEFAATIPESYNMKLDTGQQWVGKAMLKRNASRWYPKDFINRKKQGFALPISRWFGEDGILAGALTERLQDASSPLREYFTLAGMNELVKKKSTDHMWLLLFLDEWLRHERKSCLR